MQSKLNEPISRRHFLAAAGLSMTCMLTTGCSITVESKSSSESPSSNESEKSPITLIGAYHPLTGINEPQGDSSDADSVAEEEQRLREYEANNDTKHIFVLVEVTPDAKKNIELSSWVELSVDKTNSYEDWYGKISNALKSPNARKIDQEWHDSLTQLGFSDGTSTSTKTLYAGSSETYKRTFLFSVGKNDLENGKTANIEWGTLTLNFDMSQIQDVATPKAMVAQLQG